MKRFGYVVFVLLVCGGIWHVPLSIADETIIIVRHAEKPALGLGQLSCRGLNRSLALPSVLLSRYGNPATIYAPNPAIKKDDKGVLYAYVRPLATIEPLAIRVALPVTIDWGMTDVASLAKHLLKQGHGTQVIAWEHHYAEALAKQLLVNLAGNPSDVPRWEDDDFDSIYILRVMKGSGDERRVLFTREQEGLNGLAESCPQ